MMKKRLLLSALFLTVVLLLAACGNAPSSSLASSSTPEAPSSEEASSGPSSGSELLPLVYRGQVDEIDDEGNITVSQLPGQNYGQPSILFHVDKGTIQDNNGIALAVGAFVEVVYDGTLTRSIPPQGQALSLTVLSGFTEGMVVNGTIQSVETDSSGYIISLLPLEADADPISDVDNQVILIVPAEALEGLEEGDLKEGAMVSAVTRGIAATSFPPQIPVHALLPYTSPEA